MSKALGRSVVAPGEVARTPRPRAKLALAAAGLAALAAVVGAAALSIAPPATYVFTGPDRAALTREFAPANLGTRVEADGQATARIVATGFAFVPSCVVVPAGRPVTIRMAGTDLVHAVHVAGLDASVVPGAVARVHATFPTAGDIVMPCTSFCGLGHSRMSAMIRVVPEDQFHPGPDGRATCAGG